MPSIGRPFQLTIAIDVCTFEWSQDFHPSLKRRPAFLSACVFFAAVYDKTAWLCERGIDLSWPVADLPGILHSDNGAEFHSRALTGACREYGIKIQYRLSRFSPAPGSADISGASHRHNDGGCSYLARHDVQQHQAQGEP